MNDENLVNANAQFALGLMHANGCGVDNDDAEDVRLFRNAAALHVGRSARSRPLPGQS